MTSRITEIINSYPPLAFTSHPALIAELEAYHAGLVGALEEAREHVCDDGSPECAKNRLLLARIDAALKAAGREGK